MVIITIPRANVELLANDKFDGDITDAQQYIKAQIEKYIAIGVIYIIELWEDSDGEPWYDGKYPSYLT